MGKMKGRSRIKGGKKPHKVSETYVADYDSEKEELLKDIHEEALKNYQKGKKYKKKPKIEEESDSDSEISEMGVDFDAEGEPKRNNVVALTELFNARESDRKLNKIDFVQTLSVTTKKETQVEDVEDDLAREISFYTQALEAVSFAKGSLMDEFQISLSKKKKSKYDSRPSDFFAEMIKSDQHMGRIKQNLLFQKQKMDKFELRKKNKEYKKVSKQFQAERVKEKKAFKQKSKELAKEYGSKNRKREGKDKKYGGVGGKGGYKRKKSNTHESSNDVSAYPGNKRNQPRKRLGKSRRS